ncbi:DUF3349 domain-containing protein [Mycobacterium sp. 1081908.1]|uniref:DUF3349 domain-containing protein n=1 Tax=Mycobacterium sp. 1081908.1 TaxID=1834066 RepID=UPI001E43CC75|nr:DUF3349 domain-containing protein [Mycobacterium sp. 1081908.1]
MILTDLAASFVAFIRAGYPHGIPKTDCRALLALLRRRLSEDEVAAVARELVARGELKIADIGATIAWFSDKPATAADLERVQRRLRGDWLSR